MSTIPKRLIDYASQSTFLEFEGPEWAERRAQYLQFVRDRHSIYEARQLGMEAPWTTDAILASAKFTNVFRILDVGSQFVTKQLTYSDSPDFRTTALRVLLYRLNNRPEPWEMFYKTHARWPSYDDITNGTLLASWRTYKYNGFPIFGNAYRTFVGNANKGLSRLDWAVRTASCDLVPVLGDLELCRTVEDRVLVLRELPRISDFLALQVTTDIGLSPLVQADEDEFAVYGPGSIVGIRDLIPWRVQLTDTDLIRSVQSLVHGMPGCPTIEGRKPSLMDIQNTLCEWGKYVKKLTQDKPLKPYVPKHPGTQPEPFLPPHWSMK